MDSVKSDKPLVYCNVQQRIYVNPEELIKRERDDSRYRKKLCLANLSDDQIDLNSRQKAYKSYVNDPTKVVAGVVCASIPFVHSIAKGVEAAGTTAQKTGVALKTAKNWGIFIVGAALFTKAAEFLINDDKTAKNFTKNHPSLALSGLLVSAVAVGNAAIHYGDKLLTKLFDNKNVDEKITESLEKSSAMRNETYKKVIDRMAEFSNSKAGGYAKQAALIGTAILAIKPFMDFAKLSSDIRENKRNLKQKRYEASRDLANDLWVKRNEPNPVKTDMQGIIVFSNKNAN